MFSFQPISGQDTEILIVEAMDEDDEFKQLDKIDNDTFSRDNQTTSFMWNSKYASPVDIKDLKKKIYKNKIKPKEIKSPFLFIFYNS